MKANAFVAFGGLVVVACGGGADPPSDVFPSAAYESVTSSSGAYAIEVRTSPQPPRVGVGSVELRIRDRGGVVVDGLTFVVIPVMPAHAHGASVRPTVSTKGDGTYVLENVSTYMPGQWELRTTIQGVNVSDDATIPLDVR